MEGIQESGNWTPASEDLLNSQYPVHRACRDGDLEALSLLLGSIEVELYQEDGFYGWTPIHWAAHFGKFSCLTRLIEHGCSCDFPTERFNQTPLHLAATNGKGHCLKWLLHCGAAINRQLACLRKLVIERSIGLDTITSKFSQTALHLASQSGHPHCVQWLVQTGARATVQDYMGETPLHKCARTGNMECVSLLISQGAKLSIRNHNGQTPSQLAADCGYQDCAAYIERAAQIEQAQGVCSLPSVNPSKDLRTEQNGVVTNGNAMEDDDMDTDLMPSSYKVNPLAGIKRGRDDCDDEECKKSRRDEPTSWLLNNSSKDLSQNGFSYTHQNAMKQNGTNGYTHLNGKFQNGFHASPNGFHQGQNGFHQGQNGFHTGQIGFLGDHQNSVFMNGSNEMENNPIYIQQQQVSINNNNVCVSTSTEEHINCVTQEQGYDSLLMESFGNQYDGS